MSSVKRFGILGTGGVEVDDNGFIKVPVIIQESGLLFGAPPAELRIVEMGFHNDEEFNRKRVAGLNRHTDLPYYLGVAKIRVVDHGKAWTDEMLENERDKVA